MHIYGFYHTIDGTALYIRGYSLDKFFFCIYDEKNKEAKGYMLQDIIDILPAQTRKAFLYNLDLFI